MPDYDFLEWNESNFDVECCAYVREAYMQRKFAFVSDYARGHALLLRGGIYLDTDVEIVRRFDAFLCHRSFWGFETGNYAATSTFGCVRGHEILAEYLSEYNQRRFVLADGSRDLATNVVTINRILERHGLVRDGKEQSFGQDNRCYPMSFFSPYDYVLCESHRTNDTVAIHRYKLSWGSPASRLRRVLAPALAAVAKASGFGRLWSKLRRPRAQS